MLLRPMLVCLIAVSVWSTAAHAGPDEPRPTWAEAEGREHASHEARPSSDGAAQAVIISTATLGAIAASVTLFIPELHAGKLTATSVDPALLLQILVTPAIGSLAGSVLGVVAMSAIEGDADLLVQRVPLTFVFGGGAALVVVGAAALIGAMLLADEPGFKVALGAGALLSAGLLPLGFVFSPVIAAGAAAGGAVFAYDFANPGDAE